MCHRKEIGFSVDIWASTKNEQVSTSAAASIIEQMQKWIAC
jgi:hypothetical protein